MFSKIKSAIRKYITLVIFKEEHRVFDEFGNYHCLTAPAIEDYKGNKIWYRNGVIHRDNGPAIEYYSGNKSWYKHGMLHRLDGPAIYLKNRNKVRRESNEWCINGYVYSKPKHNRLVLFSIVEPRRVNLSPTED